MGKPEPKLPLESHKASVTRKRGRPRKPAGEKGRPRTIRLTEDEWTAVESFDPQADKANGGDTRSIRELLRLATLYARVRTPDGHPRRESQKRLMNDPEAAALIERTIEDVGNIDAPGPSTLLRDRVERELQRLGQLQGLRRDAMRERSSNVAREIMRLRRGARDAARLFQRA